MERTIQTVHLIRKDIKSDFDLETKVMSIHSSLEGAKAALDSTIKEFKKYFDHYAGYEETEVNEYSYQARTESIFLKSVHIYIETRELHP